MLALARERGPDSITTQAIADRMGVSPHMVKKHVVRGLAVCRRAMGDAA